MSNKVLFASIILTVFSLFYIATHQDRSISLSENSVSSSTCDTDSAIMREAYFYGIDSNFFRENSPELYKKQGYEFDIAKQAKFWGINVISD